jgi:predicted ATPase
MLFLAEIQNYKSLASTVVNLRRFTVLVGVNGAGKSNFIDALRFINECLVGTISLPIQNRGGIGAVRRKSRGHPRSFGFRLGIELESEKYADFSFEIAPEPRGAFEVKRERCAIRSFMGREDSYEIEHGKFIQEVKGIRAKIEPDRLALPLLSATEEFHPVYDYLINMRFYSLALDKIRGLQEADSGEVLKRDGSNAAAVLREIMKRKPNEYNQVCQLLSKVVPGTSSAEYVQIGQKETIRFKQEVEGDDAPWAFDSVSMSDGTLRVLGILLSVFQVSTPSLIAIEEPEASIHPAALDVLVDILKAGTHHATQIIITTHSPDLIDNRNIDNDEILVVESIRGKTTIAPIGLIPREMIKNHLYTPGEMLRSGELEPDREEVTTFSKQINFFNHDKFNSSNR